MRGLETRMNYHTFLNCELEREMGLIHTASHNQPGTSYHQRQPKENNKKNHNNYISSTLNATRTSTGKEKPNAVPQNVVDNHC